MYQMGEHIKKTTIKENTHLMEDLASFRGTEAYFSLPKTLRVSSVHLLLMELQG